MFFPVPIGVTHRFELLIFRPNLGVFRFTTFGYPATTTFQRIAISIQRLRFQLIDVKDIDRQLIFLAQRVILSNNLIRCEAGRLNRISYLLSVLYNLFPPLHPAEPDVTPRYAVLLPVFYFTRYC